MPENPCFFRQARHADSNASSATSNTLKRSSSKLNLSLLIYLPFVGGHNEVHFLKS